MDIGGEELIVAAGRMLSWLPCGTCDVIVAIDEAGLVEMLPQQVLRPSTINIVDVERATWRDCRTLALF